MDTIGRDLAKTIQVKRELLTHIVGSSVASFNKRQLWWSSVSSSNQYLVELFKIKRSSCAHSAVKGYRNICWNSDLLIDARKWATMIDVIGVAACREMNNGCESSSITIYHIVTMNLSSWYIRHPDLSEDVLKLAICVRPLARETVSYIT